MIVDTPKRLAEDAFNQLFKPVFHSTIHTLIHPLWLVTFVNGVK